MCFHFIAVISSVPKAMTIPALATFALSIGFSDLQDHAATNPDNGKPMPVVYGTAVAIDPHHLLTSAHAFELDLNIWHVDIQNLRYKYVIFR